MEQEAQMNARRPRNHQWRSSIVVHLGVGTASMCAVHVTDSKGAVIPLVACAVCGWQGEPGRPSCPAGPGPAVALVAWAVHGAGGHFLRARDSCPGHTASAADYLWSAAPWNTSIPSGHLPTIGASTHWSSGSNTQLVDDDGVRAVSAVHDVPASPYPAVEPYIMGGSPYLGDMQSAIFSPFSLPAYILPFWWSLSVIAVLKLVVAAMGAYLLARAMQMRFAGALLCGIVFGFGLFMVAWLPWPLTNVFPLIPWMLLATERLMRRPGVLSAVGAGRARRSAILRWPPRDERPCAVRQRPAISSFGSCRHRGAAPWPRRRRPAGHSRLGALVAPRPATRGGLRRSPSCSARPWRPSPSSPSSSCSQLL